MSIYTIDADLVGKLLAATRKANLFGQGAGTQRARIEASVNAGTVVICVEVTPHSLKVIHDGRVLVASQYDFAVVEPTGKLAGQSFCITGELSYPRDFYKSYIQVNGGDWKTAVSKGLSYLVTNFPNSNTSKLKTATKFGVKIISERDMLHLVTGR